MNKNNVFSYLSHWFNKYEKFKDFESKYNPWNYEEASSLVKRYNKLVTIENYNIESTNSEYFKLVSYLKECDTIENKFSWVKSTLGNSTCNSLKLLDRNKVDNISIHYEKPSHIFGNIENGIIFHCLINPNIYTYVSKEKYNSNNTYDFKAYLKQKINLYSKKFDEIYSPIDIRDICDFDESIVEKEFNEIKQELKDKISNTELNEIINTKYYLSKYFAKLFTDNDKQKLSRYIIGDIYYRGGKYDKNTITKNIENINKNIKNKIVNLESYPFKSSKPNERISSLENPFIEFSAYIIIWRICKSIKNEDDLKPVFIFRGYKKHWHKKILNVINKILNESKNNKNVKAEEIEQFFIENYFYTNSSTQNASLSYTNIIKINPKTLTNDKKENQVNIDYELYYKIKDKLIN